MTSVRIACCGECDVEFPAKAKGPLPSLCPEHRLLQSRYLNCVKSQRWRDRQPKSEREVQCVDCATSFNPNRHGRPRDRCDDCRAEHKRRLRLAWYARNPGARHAAGIKHLYGLTADDYAKLLAAQGGRCAICDRATERRLVVDHCHDTGKVRGLLCIACNVALGRVACTPERFDAVTKYLAG